MKITSAIDIESTPEIVFSWLEKPEKATIWMTSVSTTEILHETTNRVGTTFREIVEDEGGAIEMKGVITGYVPNKSISFHLDSRVNVVDVEYCIQETHAGVRLVENADVRWKFPVNLLSLILGGKMRQNILAQLRAEFNKLKELCEDDVSKVKIL